MHRAVLFTVALSACATPAADKAPDVAVADRVRRLSAMLDYVSADYPGCVARGQITSPDEFKEQQLFLTDATALLKALPPPKIGTFNLFERTATLRRSIDVIAPAEEVSPAARTLSRDVLLAYGVVIAPTSPPSYERGQVLFKENCARCHGETGAGDGPRTREQPPLKVPPRSFLDPTVMATMSPVRAFNALTDGIPEAEMPKWDLLSARDRWNLAFYVMTLRHPKPPGGKSGAAPPLSVLASSTDRELERQKTELGYLRRIAPYALTGSLATTQILLGESLEAYRNKDPVAARQKAAAAYLDGFEPHEASLDRQRVVDIERSFLSVREAMARGETVDAVEQRVLELQHLLEKAMPHAPSSVFAFLTTLAIVVREGMEAALLILLLLAAVQKAGGGPAQRRAIHAGWLGALAVGVLTWFVADYVFGALGGARREWLEGVVAILAALVLFVVSHFVLVKADARRRVQAIRDRLQETLRSGKSSAWLASIGFIAVFREAFETVLFLQALVLDAETSGAVVLLGVMAGTALLVGIVYGLIRLGRRINPGKVLSVLGGLMCALSIVMIGKGVRSLQEAGAIGQTALGTFRFELLGIYPTFETIAAQVAMAFAFAILALRVTRSNVGPSA